MSVSTKTRTTVKSRIDFRFDPPIGPPRNRANYSKMRNRTEELAKALAPALKKNCMIDFANPYTYAYSPTKLFTVEFPEANLPIKIEPLIKALNSLKVKRLGLVEYRIRRLVETVTIRRETTADIQSPKKRIKKER